VFMCLNIRLLKVNMLHCSSWVELCDCLSWVPLFVCVYVCVCVESIGSRLVICVLQILSSAVIVFGSRVICFV